MLPARAVVNDGMTAVAVVGSVPAVIPEPQVYVSGALIGEVAVTVRLTVAPKPGSSAFAATVADGLPLADRASAAFTGVVMPIATFAEALAGV